MLASESVRPAHQSAAAGASTSSRGDGMTPGWDDQIVPALRKRLESESVYLADRLSATQFDDQSSITGFGLAINAQDTHGGHSRLNTFPSVGAEQPSYPPSGKFRPDQPRQPPPRPRNRMRSGPVSPPLGTRKPRALPTDRFVSTPSSSSHRAPHQHSPEVSSPSQTNGENTSSRIPTRPRSKSQLVSRPILDPDQSQVPRMPSPSKISMTVERRSQSPISRDRYGNGLPRESSARLPEVGRNRQISFRGPLSMDGNRITEGYIKHELPPFKMLPEEALRIAERGYDLDEEEMDGRGGGWYDKGRDSLEGNAISDEGGPGEGSGERKRAITMRNNGGRGGKQANVDLGLGLPASIPNARNAPKVRSGSSRVNTLAPTAFSGSRSASYNALSSPPQTPNLASTLPNSRSRMGIAAHLVPPESTYTPPKGANWDEVVLPAVAKKLGMGESSTNDVKDAGEEDLAVEWDKDGTPIRWIKRKNLGKPALAEHLQKTPQGTPTSSSGFRPTLEVSPENPFSPAPKMGRTENIELCSLQDNASSPYKNSNHSQSSIKRKPSLFRKNSLQRLPQPIPNKSLRGQYQNDVGKDTLGSDFPIGQTQRSGRAQPPTPGTTHHITDAIYEKHLGARDRKASFNAQELYPGVGPGSSAGGKKKGVEDGHGKGCGCVIM